MIRYFINICLLISTFGYGMALAYDGHWDESQEQFSASADLHENHESPATDQHDATDCDHCCHANAHLTGIAATDTSGLSANGKDIYSAYTKNLISFQELPAAPPPRY